MSKKEQRIEELEKTKPTFEQEGLIIQNRDVYYLGDAIFLYDFRLFHLMRKL